MVKIRLRRVGAKKQPSYRVIVADSRVKRDGRFLEIIGHYNPRTDPPTVVIKEDRALYWLSVGAQPTDAVASFFVKMSLPDKLKQVHAGAKIEDLAPSSKPVKAKAVKPAEPTPVIVAAAPKIVVVDEPVAETPAVVEAAAPEPVAETPAIVEAAAPEPVAETPAVAEAAAPEPVAETPAVAEAAAPEGGSELEVLGLSPRVLKALEAADVHSLDQLRALRDQGYDAVLALPGIGEKAVDEILAQLTAHEGTGG
ncbi:MAG: 30S ribosomal protein S16 [Anaerolineae bacterium]